MWIVFSVLTVLLWGSSDVIFKSASERTDELGLLALNGAVYGLACFAYWAFFVKSFELSSLVKYLPVAAIYISSMLFYYKMLPKIKISIASPIANSSCVLTTLLCVTVLKQSVTALQAAAILMIVASIAILSLDRSDIPKSGGLKARDYLAGIGFALLYFILDGTGSFLDDYVLDEALSASDVIIAYGVCYFAVGIVCLFLAAKKRGAGRLDFRFALDKKVLCGCAVETAGQFTYVFAYAGGDAAIASPFIASFSAVSIILSRIFLKEKLNVKQGILVAAMIAGMFLLAIE